MKRETLNTKKIYQSDEKLLVAKLSNSGIKIVSSKEEIGVPDKRYKFGYYNEETFHADTNKLYQYGFYDKGQFTSFNNSLTDECKGVFGYLHKGIFNVHKTPPEFSYPKKYQFGYTDNGTFISLQKFQDNQYDLGQFIPERKYPKSKVPVSFDNENQTFDPIKYIM